MLIEVLLRWKTDGTPELHAAKVSPVFVDPTGTQLEKLGDLLRGQYGILVIRFKAR
jgi:hypothetical protein